MAKKKRVKRQTLRDISFSDEAQRVLELAAEPAATGDDSVPPPAEQPPASKSGPGR